ncbi:(Fe-S)-binding protein [Snuella lapsa]|uniref:Heterodisulfide reductase-related iron-sulfur binding cluster n=1 Tax=Snuella lapsa TaxID=870481 RepID=A0ABP6WQ57_9FLAO
MNELSREIYGNIDSISKALFYLCAFAAMGILIYGILKRRKLWDIGKDTGEKIDWKASLKALFKRVFTQKTVRSGVRKKKAGRFHALMFFGFMVLFIGTCLVAVEEYGHLLFGAEGENLIHKGLYFVVYEIFMDTFGLIYTIGALWFLVRMLQKGRGDSVRYRQSDFFLVAAIFFIGWSGYWIEGLRIIRENTAYPWLSYVGNAHAHVFRFLGVNETNVDTVHLTIWWLHGLMVFTFIASLPFTRLLHIIAGAWNLCLVRREPGDMVPVTLEELEETGKVGVENIQDFSQRQLLSLDACVACGRCTDACPATEAGKPLSPRDVVQDIRSHFNTVAPLVLDARKHGRDEMEDQALLAAPKLHGDIIKAETLWSCTTCNACHEVCPLDVSPVSIITDMRRFLIGEGALSGPPAASLQKVQRSGNPWGLPVRERFNWAEGLNVPTVQSNPEFEVLYWIGCSASYDRRIQKVAHAVVKLLDLSGVNYATLGPEERCTGEFARRMGDEFLFQESAEQNITVLQKYKVKTIITHCPHCLNSLSKDYPQFGGDYKVLHHTQFLSKLIDKGKLKVDAKAAIKDDGSITYHDPCYLARVNGIESEPRGLIEAAAGKKALKEVARSGCQSSCCGAGGGRMWFDDEPDERIGRSRVKELLDTKAKTVAVSCPFCLTMMTDGVAAKTSEVKVKDISEILAQAIDAPKEKEQ